MLNRRSDEFMWEMKYRPSTLEECVLPKSLLVPLQGYVLKGEISHLLFVGSPGTGKTTSGLVIAEILEADVLMLNSSSDNGIDIIRNKIRQFASSMSLTGKPKLVILDEMDNLSHDAQKALRGTMEEFASNCRFIGTCNYPERILEPLRERFSRFDFTITQDEKKGLQRKCFERCKTILETEGVEYDQATLAELVKKEFPNFRKILILLQRYSLNGKIDAGILSLSIDDIFSKLVEILKSKNFTSMRKWVAENVDQSSTAIFSELYKHSSAIMEPQSIPQLILIINDAQRNVAIGVASQEINLAACLVEVMSTCQFK
jgi:DNA polymerase III delta prime subunit